LLPKRKEPISSLLRSGFEIPQRARVEVKVDNDTALYERDASMSFFALFTFEPGAR
jgi:hypothetical protein